MFTYDRFHRHAVQVGLSQSEGILSYQICGSARQPMRPAGFGDTWKISGISIKRIEIAQKVKRSATHRFISLFILR